MRLGMYLMQIFMYDKIGNSTKSGTFKYSNLKKLKIITVNL
jgi:hypothetical protein